MKRAERIFFDSRKQLIVPSVFPGTTSQSIINATWSSGSAEQAMTTDG
jgi:hypothetical protein